MRHVSVNPCRGRPAVSRIRRDAPRVKVDTTVGRSVAQRVQRRRDLAAERREPARLARVAYRQDDALAEQAAEGGELAAALPGTGITRTAVVLWLITPMATSSAIRAARVSASVSPGTAIMSRPTEQTAVIASSLARVRSPSAAASASGAILADGDERAREAADRRRGEAAALLHRVVQQARARPSTRARRSGRRPSPGGSRRRCRPTCGRRGEREVDDPERHARAARRPRGRSARRRG